jgi:hypothetical protein
VRPLHRPLFAWHHRDGFHPHQIEHEIVATGRRAVTVGHTFFDHKAAAQTFFHRSGQGDAAMVGLRCTTGDQCGGPFFKRIGRQEFQLACFVTAWEKTQHVIPFDPDARPFAAGASGGQGLAKAWRQLQRRWVFCVNTAWETGQVHGAVLPLKIN